MENLIAVAVVSGATVISFGLALLIEFLLLEVILGCVARAHVDEEALGETPPQGTYPELRRLDSIAQKTRA